MAAYATFDDVAARAGRFAGVFSIAGKRPDQADVEMLLDNVAAEIDAAVRARGFDPATMDANVRAAFLDLNAYGALARALRAATTGDEADKLITAAEELFAAGLLAIAEGSFSAILQLEAGAGGAGGATAGDLWGDEPSYGSAASVVSEANQLSDTNLAPAFSRDMPA